MADFDLGKVNITEMIKITDSETGEVSYLIQKNDVLIALTGNHPQAITQVVGEASKYKLNELAFLNQRVAKIKARENMSNDFLYYFLKDDASHDYLASQSSGSANQANISK